MDSSNEKVHVSIILHGVSRGRANEMYLAALRQAGAVDSTFSVFANWDDTNDVEETPSLEEALRRVLNRNSLESYSGTPDYILAQHLLGTLDLFNRTVRDRAEWRGESLELPALQKLREEQTPR